MAVNAGRSSAFLSRALPALDSRVRFLTLVPDRYSRGARPAYAAACWAVAKRAEVRQGSEVESVPASKEV